jgi:hypothetical protein
MMKPWLVQQFEISGHYTGSHVYRYRFNQREVIHVIAAKDGFYATPEERERVQEECQIIANFLNGKMRDLNTDYYADNDIARAVEKAFPHFQEEMAVTPEAVAEIGKEYLQLITDPGPSKISFSDQTGKVRQIVYDQGDSGAGIQSGWTIPEDADWYAEDCEEPFQ